MLWKDVTLTSLMIYDQLPDQSGNSKFVMCSRQARFPVISLKHDGNELMYPPGLYDLDMPLKHVQRFKTL